MSLTIRKIALAILCFLCGANLALGNPSGAYEPKRIDPFDYSWRWSELELPGGTSVHSVDVTSDNRVLLGGVGEILAYDGFGFSTYPFPDELKAYRTLSVRGEGKDGFYVLVAGKIMYWDGAAWGELARGLPVAKLTEIERDASGRLWVAYGRSLVRMGNGTLHDYTVEVESPIEAFTIDAADRLWVVEERLGSVSRLALSGKRFERQEIWPNAVGDLAFVEDRDLRSKYSILYDSQDRLWVASSNKRLPPRSLDTRTGVWTAHDLFSLGGTNSNFAISETNDGVVRISGPVRIHRFDGNSWRVYRDEMMKLTQNRSRIINAPDGAVWFFERSVRIARIDYDRQKWTGFEDLLFECETGDGAQWFIERDKRIVRRDKDSGEWSVFASDSGIIDEVTALLPLGDGSLVAIGADGGQAAVSLWNGSAWKSRAFPNLGSKFMRSSYGVTPSGAVYLSAHAERAGSDDWTLRKTALWSGVLDESPEILQTPQQINFGFALTQDGGFVTGGRALSKWNHDASKVSQLLPSGTGTELGLSRVLRIDSEGGVWLAKWGEGIERWQGDGRAKFSEIDGLSSSYVADLLPLADGRMAALTSEGLNFFDGDNWSSIPIPGFEGAREGSFLKQSSDGAIWINAATSLWFIDEARPPGSIDRFRSLRYELSSDPPDTMIALQSSPEKYADTIVLRLGGTDAWFDTPSEELQFSHRVNGSDWTPFSADRIAIYDNLKPGEYVVEARARDREGMEDPTPARYLAQISIPFWQSRWFLWGSVFLAVATAALIYIILLQKVRHATVLNRTRLNFLTNISHELRSPLMLIIEPLKGFAKDAKANRWDSEKTDMALRNAERLKDLVEQLLELRKLEAGTYEPKREPYEIIHATRLAVADFATLAKPQRQTILFNANDESVWLNIDRDAYRKILDNLVLNALKYSEEGSTTRVSLDFSDSDARGFRSLQLVVEDEGIGISEEAREHIFEAFYTGGEVKLSDTRSFGVGLALVKDLVELNGGAISVESPARNEKGTRFTVRFPEVATCFAPETRDEPVVGLKEPVARTSSGALVLVVEDQEVIRNFLADSLMEEFKVLTARNGREGLEIALSEVPDVILADVMMPEMDGFELAKQVQEKVEISHIPVILQSALPPAENRQLGIDSGAIDFISKPLSIDLLKGKIHNLILTRKRFAEQLKARLIKGPSSGPEVENRESAFIEKARKTIHNNIENPDFGVEEFATALGMSRPTFYRKLKALVDASPADFIKSCRMEHAVYLLRSGVKVTEVGHLVGFVETSSFSRSFKRYYGCQPREYIAQHPEWEAAEPKG